VHTNDGSTTTTDEPHLLVRIPELGEDGTQARPTANIPFIEPVYDQSSEEARKSQQSKFNNFENEVSEEDPTSTTQLLTTTQATSNNLF
jgi:translation elongation factor EF-G